MKKGTLIGRTDYNNIPLKIGDYVMKNWGYHIDDGVLTPFFQVHKLKWNKGDLRVLLGNCHNHWSGDDVTRITPKLFKEMGVDLDKDFYWDRKTKSWV